MKLLICFVLSFILVAECSSLFAQVERMRLNAEEELSRTRVEKRQTTPEICPMLSCLNAGQSCKTNPFDTDVCQPCVDALTACVIAGQGNQTIGCACMKTANTCLQNKGGICLLYLGSFQPYCVTYGGPQCNCTAPNITSYPVSTCKSNYNCINDTTCTTKPSLGQPCTYIQNDNTCGETLFASSLSCSSTTHRCERDPGTVMIGDPCNSEMDCIGYDTIPQGTNCTGGVCVGVVASGACKSSDECAPGLYCKNSTCRAQLAPGSACSSNDTNPCSGEYTCGFEQTCIPAFSKAIGANCIPSDPQGDAPDSNECALGTGCSPITKKCRGPYSFNRCNIKLNNTDCETGTNCVCNYNGYHQCQPDTFDFTSVVSPSCKAPYDALFSCMTAANCKGDVTLPNGCAAKNCYNQAQCFLQCYLPSIAQLSYCLEVPASFNCTGSPTTNGGTNASNGGTNASNGGTNASNGGTNGTNGPSGSNGSSTSSTLVVITWFVALLLLVSF